MKEVDVKKRIFFITLTLALLLSPSVGKAKADELGELKQQVAEQNQKLQELMKRLEQLEARQKLKEKTLTEKIEEVA